MLSPFAEESIITERILDVTVRGGETKPVHGFKVYRTTVAEIIGKAITHVLEAFTPGITRDLVQIAKVWIRLRAMLELIVPRSVGCRPVLAEDGIDRRGNVRQIGEEILRQFSGIGEAKVTPGLPCCTVYSNTTRMHVRPQQNFNSTLANGRSQGRLDPGRSCSMCIAKRMNAKSRSTTARSGYSEHEEARHVRRRD